MSTTDVLGLPLMALDGERLPSAKFNEAMQILDSIWVPIDTLTGQLVSFWKLDEASGTRDDAHSTNNLTDNNTVTSAQGVRGDAAHFVIANSEFLSVADNATLDFVSAFSLSVWIKQTALVADQVIAAKWTYQTQGSWVLQADNANSDELQLIIATSLGDSGTTLARTSDANLVAGTWYHLVMIYDGSQTGNANRLKFYVNNVQKTLTFAGTIPASLQNSTADFNLGKFGGSLTRYFGGDMDLAGLWSRALAETEVRALYNIGAGLNYPFS